MITKCVNNIKIFKIAVNVIGNVEIVKATNDVSKCRNLQSYRNGKVRLDCVLFTDPILY